MRLRDAIGEAFDAVLLFVGGRIIVWMQDVLEQWMPADLHDWEAER